MPSKHMLPKGKRRQSVRAQYRVARDAETKSAEDSTADEQSPSGAKARLFSQNFSGTAKAVPLSKTNHSTGEETQIFVASAAASGMRLDAFLAQAIPNISRARAQLLIDGGQVRVNGGAAKSSHKLRAGEAVTVEGEPRPEPLHATPEDIPLDILYEDEFLAVINKPAGMMVHAGAGATDDARSRGTLVNALLHHMGKLSEAGGDLRPGIVHRLDKETSGAMVIAKDDVTHRKLSEMFSARRVHKTYIALVHGKLAKDDVTIDLPVARDLVRRTRMTTRRADGRHAVSHVHVLERLTTPYGAFTLVEVGIETGRTHQIRVHMQSLGNPVVGDTLYGAPRSLSRNDSKARLTKGAGGAKQAAAGAAEVDESAPKLDRNFLHATHLEFGHPRTGKTISVEAPLPEGLTGFLRWISSQASRSQPSSSQVTGS